MIEKAVFDKLKKANNAFKDSLVNIFYLKRAGYGVGELAELILIENINKRIRGLRARHIGQKIKNQWDSKTDIVISLGTNEVPFSVKTGTSNRLKIKNGISKNIIDAITDDSFDKIEILNKLNKELSANLFILHLTRRKNSLYLDLKKINLKYFDSIKITKRHIILLDKFKNPIVFFDLNRLVIYVYARCVDTLDSIELGRDNSEDKEKNGESLLINSIIMKACLCDIPTLRKINKIIDKKVEV